MPRRFASTRRSASCRARAACSTALSRTPGLTTWACSGVRYARCVYNVGAGRSPAERERCEMQGYTLRERVMGDSTGRLGAYVDVLRADGTTRTTVEARFANPDAMFGPDAGGVNWSAIGQVDADLATAFAAAIVRATELFTT